MKTIIIGHRQPDFDSISAALTYAEFLRSQGVKNLISGYLDTLNNETDYVLKKFKIKPPRLIKPTVIKPEDKIILVDHNEESQRLEKLNPDQIIEILDHHKVNLSLNQPIKIDIRPWGSTSTIIYDYFVKNLIEPSRQTKQLILAAIISDTVGLKSATTTNTDRQVAQKLAQQLQINFDQLTFEIFKAKSKIDHLSPQQIVTLDYKTFNFGGKATLINQIETVEQEKVLKNSVRLIEAMGQVKMAQKVDYIFCIVSDILRENSRLIFTDPKEQEIAEKAFDQKGSRGVVDIGPRLSRKKEIAPAIEKVILKGKHSGPDGASGSRSGR